jgi:hypothetical protein
MNNKLLESYDSIPTSGSTNNSGNNVGNFNQYKLMNGNMPSSNPKFQTYRQQIIGDSDNLREQCAKHVLLDIYMKVLPFDDGYCDGHRGTMSNDIDAFLADKKTTGLQYLKSAYDATKAPLLEFVIRSIDNIGSQYTESAVTKLMEDTDAGMDVPPEPAPAEDTEVDNQIVDVKKDLEYEDFLDKLKKKTVNKIVSDISDLLKDKKDEDNMSFNLKTESSPFRIAMDYITEWTMKNEMDLGGQENMIGLAIRESMLNTFDVIFKQNGSSINEYANKLRLGNGVLINEKTLVTLMNPSDERELSPAEREEARKRFGDYHCLIKKCKDGYYAKTFKARTTCYPSIEALPKDKVEFVSRVAKNNDKLFKRTGGQTA